MTELNIIGSILSGFTYCSHEVKNVVVPSGVKKISRLAFCNSIIESIFIPEGVTHIGTEAFKGCTLLTDISIPKSVTNLGEDVFSDTPWFKNLYEYFSIIGDGFLIKYNGKDTNVIIPDTVKQIYFNAFFYKINRKYRDSRQRYQYSSWGFRILPPFKTAHYSRQRSENRLSCLYELLLT